MSTEIRQKSFNTVWEHFVLNKGMPSFIVAKTGDAPNPQVTCRYKGYAGARCAMGVLLSPKELSAVREGSTAYSAISTLELSQYYDSCERPDDFYGKLQRAHDMAVDETLDAAAYGVNAHLVVGTETMTEDQLVIFYAAVQDNLLKLGEHFDLQYN